MNRDQRRAGTSPGEASPARPPSIAEQFAAAFSHHQAGRLAQAESLYRQICAVDPNHVESLHFLGVLAAQAGRNDVAVELIGKALALKPDHAEAHFNLGHVLAKDNRFDQAAAHYRQVVAIRPRSAEAHYSLGLALLGQGQSTQAMACFEQALRLKPTYHEAHYNVGHVLHEQGRLAEAADRYERALALKPDFAEAHNALGAMLLLQGRSAQAMACCERALALKPDFAPAHCNLGGVFAQQGRLEQATASFERALALMPGFAEAHCNLGGVFTRLGRLDEAMACFERALALKPDFVEAINGRAIALQVLRRPAEALASFDRVLAIKPDHRYAFSGMADAALAICDWARTARLAGELEAHIAQRKSIISPFVLLGYGSDPWSQLQCAMMFVEDKLPVRPQPLSTGTIHRHDKIRIGYLSADFHRHATAFLMAELFELHDRARFEVLGVSFGRDDQSDMRARLVRGFDQFHDVRSSSDHDAAKLLNDLQVDIAIDLKGHTQGARPGILAHRPAPVQVSYMGYPGTMGAEFIDYLIADKTVLPFDQQPFYTEKIVHLPDCYWVTDSKLEIMAGTPTRREAGLPDEGFVFCCFNNNYKITPPVFDVWMRLLGAVTGSVLWLLQDNGDAQENLCKEAAARGIDPARLVFAGRLTLEEHLARHRLADLFVDTLPIGAHTTASDALWAGLPLLTCQGNSFVGRVAASQLHAAGLPELATRDLGEYEALALRLATDASLLRGLRHRLAQNRATCRLFDTDRFRRHIESAYTTMWELQQRGESPRSFSVEP
jgi:protein O-GlcNAc transferase